LLRWVGVPVAIGLVLAAGVACGPAEPAGAAAACLPHQHGGLPSLRGCRGWRQPPPQRSRNGPSATTRHGADAQQQHAGSPTPRTGWPARVHLLACTLEKVHCCRAPLCVQPYVLVQLESCTALHNIRELVHQQRPAAYDHRVPYYDSCHVYMYSRNILYSSTDYYGAVYTCTDTAVHMGANTLERDGFWVHSL
jgi:hypothetical protein